MADITYSTLSNATTAINGTGNFDKLVQVVTLHLEAQFTAGRITGTDYATVYLGALQSTLDQAVSFTLSMNKANEEATLLEKQQTKVDSDVTLTGKQGLLVDAQELQADAQTALVDKQTLTEVNQALDIVNQTSTRSASQTTSETTAVKQRLDIEASTALKGKQEDLVDKQILTEEKQTLDVAGTTALKAKQALTQEKQALDLVGSTSLKAKQALTEAKKALDLVSSASVRDAQSTADSTLKGKQGSKIDADKLLVDAQELKIDAETTLLGKKGTTEDKQINVMTEQIALFEEQAKGFKWNADAKYLKTVLDAYAINLSVGKVADTSTKPAIAGHTSGTALSAASKAGDYVVLLKPTDT